MLPTSIYDIYFLDTIETLNMRVEAKNIIYDLILITNFMWSSWFERNNQTFERKEGNFIYIFDLILFKVLVGVS